MTEEKPKNEYLKWFIKAILAGMMISIGGYVYLMSEYRIVGAVLFSVGLFTVLVYGFFLYTGKVCYIFNNKTSYLLLVLITILGNYVGCVIMGYCFQTEVAVTMCDNKLNMDFFQILVRGVGCGILMYIAVDQYISKKFIWATFICVPVFIMAGFEHSIADMFYFASADMIFRIESMIFILIVLLGNAIGCSLIPFCKLYLDDKGSEECT